MYKLIKLTCLIFLSIILLSSCNSSTSKKTNSDKIKVAVFNGHGGAQTCIWETVAAVSLDPEMDVRTITTSDIANNVLDSIDAIIIPGGGGSRQYLNLGVENHKKIKQFIANGGGAVGICAGAYLFSNTPDYACLKLNGAQAIDIEHDNRGHGIVKITLTDEGKKLFPEIADRDTSYIMYYEGPVFIKHPSDSIEYQTLAIMQSDVHEEGDAPQNMTNNKPFFITNNYDKGRVFSTIAHPEATPGMMWMIPRMVRWTLNKPIVNYKDNVVNPDIFNKEILMTISDLKQESGYYKIFLSDSADEKIEALNWLQQKHSWDAKRWIQGLLFDEDANVRLRAAQYISQIQYLQYLPDMNAAYQNEKNPEIKNKMKVELDNLKALLP